MSAPRTHLNRFSRFGLVGAINTFIDFAVFSLSVLWLDWHVVPANVVAFLAAVGNSYVLNRRYTFDDLVRIDNDAALAMRFLVVNIGGLALSTALVWLLVGLTGPLLSKLAATAASVLWNYSASYFFVFGRTK